MKHDVRSSIDAASHNTFMAKTLEAAKILLDGMTANNYLNVRVCLVEPLIGKLGMRLMLLLL